VKPSLLKRIALGLLAVTAVAVAALATGALRPVQDERLLFERAEQQARACVQDAGHDYPRGGVPLGELQTGSARRVAFDACWTRVANDGSYSSLRIPTPAALLSKARTDGYRLWRCVEDGGFRRTTAMPLNAPGGYPLMPTSRHFAGTESQKELGAFYQTVARCGDLAIEDLRGPDGKWVDVPADGAGCQYHRHSGDRHSHGCYSAESYPEDL